MQTPDYALRRQRMAELAKALGMTPEALVADTLRQMRKANDLDKA